MVISIRNFGWSLSFCVQMVDLDLNMPADGDDDMPVMLETVDESPDPVNVGNLDDEGSGRGPEHN